jgi:amidase
VSDDLCYLAATEAAALFRARKLSPVALLEALITRAETTEPTINAFTYRYFDDARAAARKAEARFMSRSARLRPLEGLPVAIKDAGHLRGKPTSAGSLIADETPQPASSPVNDRVVRAGAIVHARSAPPEFSCASVTHSRRWGITRNPWAPAFTPGGSSGGAGASLAAGTSLLATGSDIGGSIRIPAACCGVVGFKPPRGRNPVDAPFNLDFYCHTGPMARSVADAMLLQNVMSGPHPEDPTMLPSRIRLSPRNRDVAGWRIAASPDLGFYPLDPEIRQAFETACDSFRDLGARVEPIALPFDASVAAAARAHLAHLFGASIAVQLDSHADLLTPYARGFAEEGRQSSPAAFYNALEIAGRTGRAFAAALLPYDLLICPTTALPAVAADHDPTRDRLDIAGHAVEPMLGWVMTPLFNMLSHHPVLSVPCGRAANGVPLGLQIVGRPFDDAAVFRAGLAFEAATGGWFRNPATRPAPSCRNRA